MTFKNISIYILLIIIMFEPAFSGKVEHLPSKIAVNYTQKTKKSNYVNLEFSLSDNAKLKSYRTYEFFGMYAGLETQSMEDIKWRFVLADYDLPLSNFGKTLFYSTGFSAIDIDKYHIMEYNNKWFEIRSSFGFNWRIGTSWTIMPFLEGGLNYTSFKPGSQYFDFEDEELNTSSSGLGSTASFNFMCFYRPVGSFIKAANVMTELNAFAVNTDKRLISARIGAELNLYFKDFIFDNTDFNLFVNINSEQIKYDDVNYDFTVFSAGFRFYIDEGALFYVSSYSK